MKRVHARPSLLLFLSAICCGLGSAQAQRLDDTAESAIFLLRQAIQVTRTGRHHTMLLSLRLLGDPELKPLFSHLVESDQASLQIHGILGLADCDAKRELDLVRLAKIEQPALQAQAVSAAMNAQTLSDDQAAQILKWPGMDDGVRIVVATQLLQSQKFDDVALLREQSNAENPARRGLVGLLLNQMGDPEGMKLLQALDRSTEQSRDAIRVMLLETAVRSGFDRTSNWAWTVSNETGVGHDVGMMALQASLRFGVPGAADLWKQRFTSASEPAMRIRLALLALRVAGHLDPELFRTLTGSDDPLLAAIGRAGEAVASKRDVALQVVNLVQMGHAIANEWSLRYARREAEKSDAVKILMGLILAFDPQKRNSAQLLDDAVSATTALYELDAAAAAALLRPMLQDAQTQPMLKQALLLGLLRCQKGTPDRLIDGLTTFGSPPGDAMACVLRAKHAAELPQDQLDELALVVRGGANLTPELRVQAGWIYLRLTRQTRSALARAMEP